jgi:hypothetical protein
MRNRMAGYEMGGAIRPYFWTAYETYEVIRP